MISLQRKEDCCGCEACKQACPKSCISMLADGEGYPYPSVALDSCVNCGICEKVCPVINRDKEREPLAVYAAKNKDYSTRLASSSGGMFMLLAEKVIADGGVVFGVKFDGNWNAVFDCARTLEEASAFSRSKYIQAEVADAYVKVKNFLSEKKLVLFTGTPCQIAGLRHFLGKDFENLILMDLICEGVPSPKVWQKYLGEELEQLARRSSNNGEKLSTSDLSIEDISFRDKTLGWKKFSFKLAASRRGPDGKMEALPAYINRRSAYLQAMFRYLDLRPICYECPFKSCRSQSDVTVADYWGINYLHPDFDDNIGVSMLYLNTEKGARFFPLDRLECFKTDYSEAFKYNNILTSPPLHPNRAAFFRDLDASQSIIGLLEKHMFTRGDRIKLRLRKLLGDKSYKRLVKIWRLVRK